MRWAERIERTRAAGTRKIACAVAILAFAVRFAWVMAVQSPFNALFSDMAGYHGRALDFLDGATHGEPRSYAFFPWGAHVLIGLELGAVGRTSHVGVAIIHSIVSTIPAVCVVCFTARVVRSRILVGAAGVVAALWQPAVAHAGVFMSEMWFSAAIVLGTLLVLRWVEGRSGALGAGCAFAIATVVRPQALLTILLLAALLATAALLRDRVRWTGWFRFFAPVAVMLVCSAVRLHALTGHYGLVSENGPLNRVFGATSIGRIEAHWRNEYGDFSAWYIPPAKIPVRPENAVAFEGYIGDGAILERIQEERTRHQTRLQAVVRMWRNTRQLIYRFTFPESDEHLRTPVRQELQRFFRLIVVNLIPIGTFGLLAMLLARKTRLTALVIVANGLTVVTVAALYFAEARMRMPYDPFVITCATAGLANVIAIGRRVRSFVRERTGATDE